MKKILGLILVVVLFSSCNQYVEQIECPCIVIKVNKVRYLGDDVGKYWNEVTVQSVSDNTREFQLRSTNDFYEIGDSLNFVKRK